MVLFKYGENFTVSSDNFISTESIKQDTELHDKFIKIAANWKKIAPKADDFLYFTAVMMHAAERSLYDEDGNLLKNAKGEDLTSSWEVNEKTGSWKWVCNDPNVMPYKNQNLDAFPISELKTAYKKWVGKPLCKDHQSSSVDGTRGFIVDTYWDDKHKRIIALCALDKITYPDLARKVATGYLNNVSMGVGVGKAICFNCGNVAKTEAEYCSHMKHKTAYCEINTELEPIELSLVVNGADKKATILEVLAATKLFEENLKKNNSIDLTTIRDMKEEFVRLANKIDDIEKDILESNDNNLALKKAAINLNNDNDFNNIKERMGNIENMIKVIAKNLNMEELMTSRQKNAYFQGTEEPTPGKAQYTKEEADKIRLQDSHMKEVSNLGPVDGIPAKDLEVKKMQARAAIEERRALRAAAVAKAQTSIKRAYPVGGESVPKGGYPVDPGNKVRDTEFTFNKGNGNSGLYDDDEKVKKQLSRASLKARLIKANNASNNKWEIVNTANDKVILSATFAELAGNKPALYTSIASDEFAREMMKTIRSAGVNKAAKFYKLAQALPAEQAPVVEPTDPETAGSADPAPEMGDADLASPPAEEAQVEAKVDPTVLKDVAKTLADVAKKIEQMVGGTDALTDEFSELPKTDEVMENPEAATEKALADLTSETPKNATASLNKIRIVLNAGLKKAFKKNIKGLKTSKDELELIVSTAHNNSMSPEFLSNISKQALVDSQKLLKKARILQKAFVTYAKGTLQLEKRANMERRMRKIAQQTATTAPKATEQADVEFPTDKIKGKVPSPQPAPKEEPKPAPKTASGYNLNTVEGRRNYRHKLAAATESKMKYSEMIGAAHPKSDTVLKGIQGTSEAVVEGIDTAHEDMMKAVSEDPKVKKAAAQLNTLIKAGKLKASELDTMVKEGLDKTVVDYWKKFYGQVDGGSEFATALTKDYSKAASEKKAAENLENYKAKYAKAYDLAYDMSEAGLIQKNNTSIKSEADKIVNYTDEAYASMRRVTAHHAATMKKTASIQVGVAMDSDNITAPQAGSLYDELVSAFAFSGKRY